mmetsp:Transcript_2882/g.6282  ORF Transcript_2882/g.6282 Transcript_2882/m.6282 type:complete len:373 (-) Transcript_2882:299-1417(-)
MDGYSPQAMLSRCIEDYGWDVTKCNLASERANMMAGLYDNEDLWDYVSMVAFAEHYVVVPTPTTNNEDDKDIFFTKPYETFQRYRDRQPQHLPIFGGVVMSHWEACDESERDETLASYAQRGIDYVRLECNFGSIDDIGEGGASRLLDDPRLRARFRGLAGLARRCQEREMVPLVLLQVPWRENRREGEESSSLDHFEKAIEALALEMKDAGVISKKLLLETRPPVGMSARDERALTNAERITLGIEIGRNMFAAIRNSFEGGTIPGFCVAGGSTKGENPTAMEDDTQNAVRQGMRSSATESSWGYPFCFWEMGAKLMLQPEVGRLWWGDGNGIEDGIAQGGGENDAASELFCRNAKGLAEEIAAGISIEGA